MKIELRWKRVLYLSATGILATLIALAAGSAWMYTWAVLHPGCQGDRASLEVAGFTSEAVEFQSRDGPVLRGWYTRGDSHPEVAIIVIPGHGGNSAFAVADASMLGNMRLSLGRHSTRPLGSPKSCGSCRAPGTGPTNRPPPKNTSAAL